MESDVFSCIEDLREAIRRAPLLRHVGGSLTGNAAKCQSWSQLLELHDSIEWSNAYVSEANRIRRDIQRFSPAIYNRDWNNLIESQWPWYDEIVRPVVSQRCPNQSCADAVNIDFRRLFTKVYLESVWKEHMMSFKHHEWLQFFLQGHIPCGWEGDYPSGQLIVF